jgi:heterokaryon incompatibility protein (HET)
MPKYSYSKLSATNIRLLRLLPKERDPTKLRCELFDYPIFSSDRLSHLYEAVSYVWGHKNNLQSIIIDDYSLDVTQNLYKLLLRLRDNSLPRIIWVDAVCINQKNEKEKESQIRLMAEIYAKASRVIVSLGEAQYDSNQALEIIRVAGEKSINLSEIKPFRQAVLELLQRPWFRRIWVRKESSKILAEVTK